MKQPKLNIGFLINNVAIENWNYKLWQELKNSEPFNITTIVLNEDPIKKPSAFLFNLYSKFDARRVNLSNDAFKTRSIDEILNEDHVFIESSELSEKEKTQLLALNIDAFIDFRINSKTLDLSAYSSIGSLKMHHGVYHGHYPKIAGIWELFDGWDATGTVLELKAPHTKQRIHLDQLFLNKDKSSITRNRNMLFWKSNLFLIKNLRRIQKIGVDNFREGLKNKGPSVKSNHSKYQKLPNGLSTLKSGVTLQWQGLKAKIQRSFFFDQWILLYKFNENQLPATDFSKFSRLMPPKDRFWADPFVYQNDGKYFIFIEEFLYSEGKGKISVIEMDAEGNIDQPEVVLEKDYHLSYPFLFEDDGKLYMLPETSMNNTIELYKCIAFPYKWELIEVLFDDIKTVDSTLFKWKSKYWLFTNVEAFDDLETINELHLFSSDSLLNGKWTSHPMNPLQVDHSVSRPAGAVFKDQDHWIRPSQNCSKQYGYGMNFQNIMTLNENHYKEETKSSVIPDWDHDLLATHTFNHAKKLTVIDAMIKRKK